MAVSLKIITYLFSEKRLKDILTSSSFEMKCLICENALIYGHNIRCYDPKSTFSHENFVIHHDFVMCHPVHH